LLVILSIILFLFLLRLANSREIDDVSPGIYCEKEYLEKSDTLWVIPKFENNSIADNVEWCNSILELNKTIGLHGVYHNYREFDMKIDDAYLKNGIRDFEKCFGYKPKEFKAPQLSINGNNVNLVETEGMKVRGWMHQITHKVYHCSNTGLFSNRFIDWF